MLKISKSVLFYLLIALGSPFQAQSLAGHLDNTQQNAASTLPNVKTGKTILVLGDSLSAAHNIDIKTSWPSLLQQRLQRGYGAVAAREYSLVNASISGETSSGGLHRLPKLLDQYQPEVCILELGANDGLRGQSLKQMQHNLSQMIQQCQQHGQVLLLGVWLPPNYGPAYTNAFKASFAKLASQYQTAFVPFFLDGVAGKPNLMLSDGLHPNSKGQPQILDNVWPHLAPLLVK